MSTPRDTHLYRHKKNGKLYKLYQVMGMANRYTGDVYRAEPYQHDERVGNKVGHVNPEAFEKAYVRNA
jgi:hypothetical protein